jgi:hypothetical protein
MKINKTLRINPNYNIFAKTRDKKVLKRGLINYFTEDTKNI